MGGAQAYANARHIEIVGDLPIFVAAHSADVWSNPGLFDLDKKGSSARGGRRTPGLLQRHRAALGQPALPLVGTRRRRLSLVGRADAANDEALRCRAYRSFSWLRVILGNSRRGQDGRRRTVAARAGEAVFNAMRRELGDAQGRLRIIAEDLGIITPEVNALRQAIGLPGMRILQFAFDGDAKNPYLPHNYDANTVVYTGTHDNDTSRGWWESLSHPEQDYVRSYLGVGDEAGDEECTGT
jgi:4-alpha-glucanotransferase